MLERSHRGVSLTAAGEALLPYAVEADSALARLLQQARSVADGRAIPVRIGSFSSVSNTWLPQALVDFRAAHPYVSFDLRIGTDVLGDWLLHGQVDLALGDADRCKGFRWYPLMDDPYFAVMPSTEVDDDVHTITQADLMAHPFIDAISNALERHLQTVPEQRLNIACDDDSTLLSMVAQGFGVTAMPQMSLHTVPQGVRVLQLEPPTKRVVGVAVPAEPSKPAAEFVEFLLGRFPYESHCA